MILKMHSPITENDLSDSRVVMIAPHLLMQVRDIAIEAQRAYEPVSLFCVSTPLGPVVNPGRKLLDWYGVGYEHFPLPRRFKTKGPINWGRINKVVDYGRKFVASKAFRSLLNQVTAQTRPYNLR